MKQKMNKEWEESAIKALAPHIQNFINNSLQKGKILDLEFGSKCLSPCMAFYHPSNSLHIDPKSTSAWKVSLSSLGIFDTILCSDFSFEINPVSHRSAKESLESGKRLLSDIETKFKDLSNIHYSDNDLDLFCKSMSNREPEALSKFLGDLCKNKQITKNQRDLMEKKYHLASLIKHHPSHAPSHTSSRQESDPLLPILKDCIKNHMHKGSKFIALCGNPTSKFESTPFFEEIITNPLYNFEEKLICADDLTMLGFIVEKLGE